MFYSKLYFDNFILFNFDHYIFTLTSITVLKFLQPHDTVKHELSTDKLAKCPSDAMLRQVTETILRNWIQHDACDRKKGNSNN